MARHSFLAIMKMPIVVIIFIYNIWVKQDKEQAQEQEQDEEKEEISGRTGKCRVEIVKCIKNPLKLFQL